MILYFMDGTALFTEDTLVFGLLMLTLAFVFYTSSRTIGFWAKFYSIIPALLMCYMLPAVLNSIGLISPETSKVYDISKNYLLPAALVLMTLSLDLKSVFNLGPKALIMFFTGTIGIIIGGPIAILLVSIISPETVGGAGPDAVWRGLSTIAGSWIGGGANQTAMYEIFEYNPEKFGAMILVDIVVAQIWMALLLFGIGQKDKIDKWLKSDNTAIETLKQKVIDYEKSVLKIPTLTDYIIMFGIAFTAVGISHFSSNKIASFLSSFKAFSDKSSALASFTSTFFWMVTIATIIGILLSFTKIKKYEGTGASKLGSVFIYILVASIGMKMDLKSIFENPGLLFVGLIWMAIHVILLIIVAKAIRAPYFFLAVGSKANVGGAASAPVVAAAFHPSLATVGVLLAVVGYAIGTFSALFCASLMEMVSVS